MKNRFFNGKTSIFFKLLIVNISLIALAVSLISLVLFFLFSSESLKDTETANRLMLNNIEGVVSKNIESAQHISQELSSSPFIKRIVYANDDEWTNDMFLAQNSLMNSISSNMFIDSIYLCNEDKLLTKTSNSIVPREFDEKVLSLVKQGVNSKPILSSINIGNNRTKNYISIVTGERYTLNTKYQNAVIVNIDIDGIYQSIYKNFIGDMQDVLIIDSDGRIILSRDKKLIGSMISPEVLKKISYDNGYGNFQLYEKNKKYLYDYVGSKNGYIYIYKTAYWLGQKNLLNAAISIICISAFVFSFILFISIGVFKKVYNPINEIFLSIRGIFKDSEQVEKQLSELQIISNATSKAIDTINRYEHDLENKWLQDILIANKLFTENDKKLVVEKMKFDLQQSANIVIAVAKICGYGELISKNTMPAVEFQISSIKDVFNEKLNEIVNCYSLIVDKYYITLIISDKNILVKEKVDVSSILANICNYTNELFKIDLSIGLSCATNDIKHISVLFNEARSLTRYSIVKGKNLVVAKQAIEERTTTSGLKPLFLTIKENLKLKEINKYNETLRSIDTAMNSFPFEQVVDNYFRLALSLINIIEDVNISEEEKKDSHKFYERINEAEDFEDIKQIFEEIFIEVSAYLDNINTNGMNELMKKSISIINETYTNSDMTAAIIAEKIAVTPTYFSKMFKESFGVGFPEYINNLRLELACKLLKENSDMDIVTISNKTGFRTPSYFTAAFKKKYAVTPSKYRINILLK